MFIFYTMKMEKMKKIILKMKNPGKINEKSVEKVIEQNHKWNEKNL